MLHPGAHLPPADTKRWVVRRKAAVVTAVRNGAISLEEAYRRYHLSEEEFLSWEQGIEFTESPVYGPLGSKSTVMFLISNRRSRTTEQSNAKAEVPEIAPPSFAQNLENVMRLLLVGQNLETTASVRLGLIKEEFNCDTADVADDGLEPGKFNDYDVILFDLAGQKKIVTRRYGCCAVLAYPPGFDPFKPR